MHRIASLRSFTKRRSVPPTGFYCDQHLHRYRPHNFLANTIKGDFKIGSHRQFRWTAVRLFSSTTIGGRLSSDDLNKVVLEKNCPQLLYRKSRCSHSILKSSVENSKLYIYPSRERSPKSNSYSINRK